MSPADAPDSQTQPSRQGRRQLEELLTRAQAGPPPTPQELAQALGAAGDQVAALAAGLGQGADQAGLAAYEAALLLCMDLTLLGLELARRHGPAYLPLPGQGS